MTLQSWASIDLFCDSVPFGAFALLVLFFLWPDSPQNRPKLLISIRKIDVVGNLLLMAASTLLVFALQQAGTFSSAWSSPIIVVTITAASISWVAFLVWEIWLGLGFWSGWQPVFPFRLVTRRPFLATIL
jgi:hypothetical protein